MNVKGSALVQGSSTKKRLPKVYLINRPGIAGAVQQTPLSLIKSLSHPFPPHLQDIINPKPLELGQLGS